MKTIKTERLILRPFEESDYDDLYEFLSQLRDDEFEGYPGITYENGREHLKYRLGSEEFYAVELIGEGKVIGNIYCGRRDFEAREVGYIINRNYQKHGYAKEALSAVIAEAFRAGAHRVFAECDPRNTSSWKLLESVGMRREAHLRRNIYFHKDQQGEPIWKDTYVYATLSPSAGETKHLVILIDADGVLEDLSQKWVVFLNERYGTNVSYDDLREWDMTAAFPGLTREQVYGVELEDEFYDRLEPIEGAVEYVGKLKEEGHEIFVVTTTPYQIIRTKMEKVIFRYFPFLSWKNVIITSNKHMIRGDVLIDDGIHNLEGGDYKKLLVSAPYNEAFDAEAHGMIRVRTWKEIYEILSGDRH